MTLGTPKEVAAATKEALRKGASGGGYILSSSNSAAIRFGSEEGGENSSLQLV
jgi:hypothetical protein